MPHRKLETFMVDEELTLRELGEILGISAQCLHRGIQRGTFSRETVAKLVAIAGDVWTRLEFDDFMLPQEQAEVRAAVRRWKRRQKGRE